MTETRFTTFVSALWQRTKHIAPVVVTLTLFAAGAAALYHVLAPVQLSQVMAQVRAVPFTTMGAALLTTLLGYLCLVGYDWSALHYIGKPQSVAVTITGGLLAYAFGNTIGLAAISGGAVRYRIYSGLGLDAYDVAAVSTFAAVSFGVAASLVGCAALALHPGALGSLLPLAPSSLRLLSLLAIVIITVPLLWTSISQKSITLGRFSLRAPSLPVVLGQVVFSLGDIAFAALTLYILLPQSDLGYLAFVAVFAAAVMAGVISHVPGGIGVFETVVLAALPASIPVGQAAAALLLFRITYFLVPFLIALIVLAVFEALVVVRGSGARRQTGRIMQAIAPALRAAGPIIPLAIAGMVFGSGILMSFSALVPPLSKASEATEMLFPLAFVEGGALLSSLLGVGLVILSHALYRRSSAAFVLTLAALGVGMATALVSGLDYERAGGLALVAAILLPFRSEFRRRSSLLHEPLSQHWLLLLGLLVVSCSFVLVFTAKSTAFSNEIWWKYAVDAHVPRALRAGLLGAVSLSAVVLVLLMRAPRVIPNLPDAVTLAQARAIIAQTAEPEAAFALSGDKALIFSDDGAAFIMYAVQGRSWIALGGPVGPDDSAQEVGFAFTDAARAAGSRPVFYEVSVEALPLMLDLGMNLFKMGEEAVVDLRGFSLDGPERKKLRSAHSRALRDGLTLTRVPPPHDPELLRRLRSVSDGWLAEKHASEKGFSVGRFDEAWLNQGDLALIRYQGEVVAFANILTGGTQQNAAIDLMRYTDAAPKNTMDFMFIELMLQLRTGGFTQFSLGMAPLSGIDAGPNAKTWNRLGAIVYRHGAHFYNFKGLRAFKEKFDPEWRPRYLAAPSTIAPIVPLKDASLLIAGGAKELLRPK
ncbi:bifunctional lysylphosphatidylglycerol flippase/synthetase MprF [Pseudorhodobacter sp.]|uniref:bifunctional lysylphosphatidylglycerol flippase/synthetase MprF n=1 Tax=Pseudorhodobacter sp. TaxID=1934400 RepID=UPI0026481D9D|nr:bifunctional lysylphosphatidylglycerol flippase/synthetase MprF [Pseudorhodobacter sp.]MDN5786324.1 bifunctional lysylphosphatidylglycerol flippase/synthetase MprF [Pseudorhodobacter sp.]